MTTESRTFGILRPVGGGDPVPLLKAELTVGRRRSCDICLDFENISGRHCALVLDNGVWHVRDLNSTNGTTLNGQAVGSNRGIMPDDEVGIAGHLFTIDYEPASSVMANNTLLEDEFSDGRPRRSLLELAGLENDSPRTKARKPTPEPAAQRQGSDREPPASLPAPSKIQGGVEEPAVLSDDEYLRLFEESDEDI